MFTPNSLEALKKVQYFYFFANFSLTEFNLKLYKKLSYW